MKTKKSDKIMDFIVYFTAFISMTICLLPFLHVIAISLSSDFAIVSNKVSIFPVDFTVSYYKNVVTDISMIRAFFFTVLLTALFTLISIIMTILAAYPLSKKRLKGKNLVLLIIVITMYFQGGIIPSFLLVKNLGLLNNMWALILPIMVNPFNLIILKTFFSTSIPESLEESAQIDGCSEMGVLLKIILPLSKPVLAVLTLFYAVFRWNSFTDVLFYINNAELYTLQLKLFQIVRNNMLTAGVFEDININIINPEGLKAASVMFVTIPILIAYPWLQKYFVKGVMIGAIKG